MTPNYLEYPIHDGFICHWLVLGPFATPVEGPIGSKNDRMQFIDEIAQKYSDPMPVLSNEPLETGAVFVPGNEGLWKYYRCREDHLVDISGDYPSWTHVSVYAFAQLHLAAPTRVRFYLTANGAVDLWVNDQSVFRTDACRGSLQDTTFEMDLSEDTKILARVRQVGKLSCMNLLRLRVEALDDMPLEDAFVHLPTRARQPRRFQELEENLEKAHLEDVVNYKGTKINLRWAEATSDDFHFSYQIQDEQERIYVEGTWNPEPAGTDIGHPFRLNERQLRIVLKAPAREFYELNNRYQREMPIYVIDTPYAAEPGGSFATRRAEALKNAAKHESNLYGQIARIASGKFDQVVNQVFSDARDAVGRKEIGSDLLLLGLLGVALRNADQVELAAPIGMIREAAQDFSNQETDSPVEKESSQLVLAACKLLAGQLLDKAGLRQEGEETAVHLIRKIGREGFQDWLSNSEMETVIAALTHLTSLAQDVVVQELAAVLLDKTLFELAVHTFHGAFASAHGATEAGMLKSAQLEATSGITRMLYGVGVYNPHIVGLVSMAVADYEFPSFFAEIANDPREEMLSRENHAGASAVTYRTPDYMLSSVQDWRAGQKGRSELVWQAAFGSDAVVFSSHPACSSESPARRPGYWLGNAVLPRVAQWKDTLVAVYNFSDQGLNYTHAYFPVHQFDEYTLKDGWAFARKSDGYLAITAPRGLELTKEGPNGYRELRSYGSPNLWICQMGRQALDGTFADFQAKVLKIRIEGSGNSVHFTNIRGTAIEFGWEGALRIDGAAQELSFGKAIENPYCSAEPGASQIEIGVGETAMRLNFE